MLSFGVNRFKYKSLHSSSVSVRVATRPPPSLSVLPLWDVQDNFYSFLIDLFTPAPFQALFPLNHCYLLTTIVVDVHVLITLQRREYSASLFFPLLMILLLPLVCPFLSFRSLMLPLPIGTSFVSLSSSAFAFKSLVTIVCDSNSCRCITKVKFLRKNGQAHPSTSAVLDSVVRACRYSATGLYFFSYQSDLFKIELASQTGSGLYHPGLSRQNAG